MMLCLAAVFAAFVLAGCARGDVPEASTAATTSTAEAGDLVAKPAASGPVTVTVFAAASVTGVVEGLAARFEAQRAGVEVRTSFGSSSTLAKQIVQGAPADVFISANAQWMDEVERAGRLRPGSRVDLLTNRLVVVTPSGSALMVRFAPGFDFAGALAGPLAVGDPEHVPAGMYARQALTRLGWWDGLSGRVLAAKDVRATLRLVALGEAEAGIVYATDAAGEPAVRVAGVVPGELHDAVVCPVALVDSGDGGDGAEAAAFVVTLRGPAGRAAFEAAGFTVVEGTE